MEHDLQNKRKIEVLTADEASSFQPNKRIKFDRTANHNASLPRELMLEIFTYLSTANRLNCSETCKYWRDCESVPPKGWILVGKDKIKTIGTYLIVESSGLKIFL